jgi:hypothetical protein
VGTANINSVSSDGAAFAFALGMEASVSEKLSELTPFPAARGAGPLLQREYWTALPGSEWTPEQLISLLRERFPEFANPLIADFSFVQEPPLEVGHAMRIAIQGYGECHVRVIHCNEHSLTLLTLSDHFEAGRITFGAYYENGVLTAKVRSRSRTRSVPHQWGFVATVFKQRGQRVRRGKR